MKFLRSNALNLFIILMAGVCLVTLAISVRLSVKFYSKQAAVNPGRSGTDAEKELHVYNPASLGKSKEFILYYNGDPLKGEIVSLNSREVYYVPLEGIFSRSGFSFRVFNPDDVIEGELGGKKLQLQLYGDSFRYGETRSSLPGAVFTAGGHIFAPIELFGKTGGFTRQLYQEKSTAFLNCSIGYNASDEGGIKVLRVTNGKSVLGGIRAGKVFWESGGGKLSNEEVIPAPGGSNYLVETENNLYAVDGSARTARVPVSADASVSWSLDGRSLYWIDGGKKALCVYDINSGVKYTLTGNSPYGPGDLAAGMKLAGFMGGGGWRTLVVSDASGRRSAWIVKNGKTQSGGRAEYSPDMKKVLFYSEGKGYYVFDPDTARTAFIGGYDDAAWVSGTRIFAKKGTDSYIVDSSGKTKMRVYEDCYSLGRTKGGTEFFMRGSELYSEKNGAAKGIIELPFKCEAAFKSAKRDWFVLASGDKRDCVFYLNGVTGMKMGRTSLLLKKRDNLKVPEYFTRNVAESPDGERVALLQAEEGFPVICVAGKGIDGVKRIVLDYSLKSMENAADMFHFKWLSDGRIFACAADAGWIVDLEGNVKVFEWKENEGSTIEGIF